MSERMITLPASVLIEAVKALEDAGCAFWACDGPDMPIVPMKTCCVCAAIQEIREILANAGMES